jgi:hypothetical protein
MHKAIPIAATCSVALHLTALALGQLLVDDSADPSIASRVLVLTVNTFHEGRYAEPELPFDDGTRTNPPSGLVTEVSGGSASASAGPTAAERDAAPPNSASEGVSSDLAVSDRDTQADSAAQPAEPRFDGPRTNEEGPQRAEYLATVSTTGQSVPAAVAGTHATLSESEPVSSAQAQMLTRKAEKWVEKYDPQKLTGIPWKHHGQEYVAKITPLPVADDVGIEHVLVEISTARGGRKLSTEIRMKRLAFSNYAQFVDRWDPLVQFHDDELDGRFHSNSEITLSRDRQAAPTFRGKVTTAAHSVNFGDKPGYMPRDRIFQGGLETGVGAIQFPERFVPFPADSAATDDRVRRFEVDTRLTFHADGSFDWQDMDAASAGQSAAISGNAIYLIAAPKVELHVRGTVNGKVLVYSPERIVIEGNLLYAHDPAVAADADDYLGIVSDRYVEIAPPDVTGPGDLTINAAIYAKRCFTVKAYGVRDGGLLNIYGSLTAGSLSATEPRYRTKIQFDRRLETLRPPSFPMTDRYEVESWDGVWKVEGSNTSL